MQKTTGILLNKEKVSANGSLWLEKGGMRFFGPGPLQLLEYIEATGSINQAAKKMEMSYKKDWKIVHNLNRVTTKPLVITTAGGEKGGGSYISEDAKELIIYYKLLRERFNDFLQQESNNLSEFIPA